MAIVYAHVTPHALRHPAFGDFVVPEPRAPYSSDDPLVKAHPWAFGTAEEVNAADSTIKAQQEGGGSVAIADIAESLETADRTAKRRRTRTRG